MTNKFNEIKNIINDRLNVEKKYTKETPNLNILSEVMFNGEVNVNEIDIIEKLQFINTIRSELVNENNKNIIKPYQFLTIKSTLNSILPDNIPSDSLSEIQIENLYNNLVAKSKSLGLWEIFKKWNENKLIENVNIKESKNTISYIVQNNITDKIINFSDRNDIVNYMNNKDFKNHSIYVIKNGKKIKVPFITSNLSKFNTQLRTIANESKKDKFYKLVSEVVNKYLSEEKSKLQKAYDDYFDTALEFMNVNSPDELPDKDKSKFFNVINKYWDNGKGAIDGWKDKMEKDLKKNINENSDEWVPYYSIFPTHKFKRGQKVLTNNGNIETVNSINSNGNIWTKENDYSYPPYKLNINIKDVKGKIQQFEIKNNINKNKKNIK